MHKLGNDRIPIKVFQYGKKKDIVFINLHSDESTSVAAAEKILKERGGLLIKVENKNKRNIRFRLHKKYYTFDPNRIFSRVGIEKTLSRFKNIDPVAIAETEKFAKRILSLLPKKFDCLFALHNNTDGNLSVTSFLPGQEYATDAKKVYAADQQDPDDFFLTTDSLLFERLSAEKYNTVWQDNIMVQQDGSLSVYCGEKNIRYLNCETEHGRLKQYEEMIRAALRCIKGRK
jgi:hypothetical protein